MKKFETDENSVKNQKYKHSENNNSILENKNNEIKSNAFLCLTDQGTVTYSTQEQLAALENMKKFETDENSVKNQKYKHSENNNSILENKNNEIKSNARQK